MSTATSDGPSISLLSQVFPDEEKELEHYRKEDKSRKQGKPFDADELAHYRKNYIFPLIRRLGDVGRHPEKLFEEILNSLKRRQKKKKEKIQEAVEKIDKELTSKRMKRVQIAGEQAAKAEKNKQQGPRRNRYGLIDITKGQIDDYGGDGGDDGDDAWCHRPSVGLQVPLKF